MTRLDTHVVVWLYAGDLDRLSSLARDVLEREPLVISPMVELELTYLREIERVTVTAREIVDDLASRLGLSRSSVPLGDVVGAAHALSWTRDPFDRLIVADAVAASAQLLTKDQMIRSHCDLAVW